MVTHMLHHVTLLRKWAESLEPHYTVTDILYHLGQIEDDLKFYKRIHGDRS